MAGTSGADFGDINPWGYLCRAANRPHPDERLQRSMFPAARSNLLTVDTDFRGERGNSAMRQSGRVYDELLVLHAQSGDMRALRRLAARWHPRLLRAARRFTGDEDAAQEAVQESWEGITAGLHRLQDPVRFPGWAFAILRRRCAERVRALAISRGRRGSLEEVKEPSVSAHGDDSIVIAQAFDRLPEEQRVAATLYFVEQLKLEEIAFATGAPLGTVKSRIFAARKSLKMTLQGEAL